VNPRSVRVQQLLEPAVHGSPQDVKSQDREETETRPRRSIFPTLEIETRPRRSTFKTKTRPRRAKKRLETISRPRRSRPRLHPWQLPTVANATTCLHFLCGPPSGFRNLATGGENGRPWTGVPQWVRGLSPGLGANSKQNRNVTR